MEDKHKCKLCSRSFINGRALGGHMKSHFPTFTIQHQTPFRSPDPQTISLNSSTESNNPTRTRTKRNWRLNTESPASSISDTSPEEDVAICLVMLSMDKGKGKEQSRRPESEKSTAAAAGKSFRCGKCRKSFRSSRAVWGHEKVCRNEDGMGKWKMFKCPYCCKVFGSGQALGGHKRSHLQSSAIDGSSRKLQIGFDLNLPAPVEQDDDDDYSLVSDAS